jgi:hypothetical protein
MSSTDIPLKPHHPSPKELELKLCSSKNLHFRTPEGIRLFKSIIEEKKKLDDEEAARQDFKTFNNVTERILFFLKADTHSSEFKEFLMSTLEKLNENVREMLRKDDKLLRAAFSRNETVPHAWVLLRNNVNSECNPSPFVITVEMGHYDFALLLLTNYGTKLLDEVGERGLSVLGVAILHGRLKFVDAFSGSLSRPAMYNCFPFGCIQFAITNAPTDAIAGITNVLAERGLGINNLYPVMDMTMVQFALVNRLKHLAIAISKHPNYTMKSHVCSTTKMNDSGFLQFLDNPYALYKKYKLV